MTRPAQLHLAGLTIPLLVALTACPLPAVAPCATDEDCPEGATCNTERQYCVPLPEGGSSAADAAIDGGTVDRDAAQRDALARDGVSQDAEADDRAGTDRAPPGDAATDAALLDTATGDGQIGDTAPGDTAAGDSSADAALADVSPLDTPRPDSALLDTTLPDAAMMDTALPDTTLPDTTLPDTTLPDTTLPDTTLPDTTLPDAAPPPVIEEHHQGAGTIADNQTEISFGLDPAVVESKSILFFNATANSNQPNSGHTGGQLAADGASVRFRRGNMATGVTVDISWTVVQLDGIFVQRGTESAPAATVTTDASLDQAVDQSRAFLLYSFHLGGGTYGDNDWRKAYFLNDQTLRFERVQGNDPGEIDWQVVEFLPASGGSVRSGSAALANGVDLSTTVSLTPATDPDHALLIFSYQLSGTSTLAAQLVSGRIDSADQLYFERAASSLGIDITWYLVEWDAMYAQHGSLSFSGSQQDRSGSLGTAVDPDRAVSFCPSYQRQGMTDYTSDDVIGAGWFTTSVTASDISAHRASALGNARVDWTVVEFQ